MARARSLRETTVTDDNESLLRTFHPALAHSKLVFTLTKKNGSKAWVVTSRNGNYARAGGRKIHEEPHYESPAGKGRTFSLTIPDPLPKDVTMGVRLTHKEQNLIRHAPPESVGVTFYPCEIVIVFFETQADMPRTWPQEPRYNRGIYDRLPSP